MAVQPPTHFLQATTSAEWRRCHRSRVAPRTPQRGQDRPYVCADHSRGARKTRRFSRDHLRRLRPDLRSDLPRPWNLMLGKSDGRAGYCPLTVHYGKERRRSPETSKTIETPAKICETTR